MTNTQADGIERRDLRLPSGRVTANTRAALARVLRESRESFADWVERHALADARKIQRKPGASDPRLWRAVVTVCGEDVAAKVAACWAEGDGDAA